MTERLNNKIFYKKSQFIRKRENQGWDDTEAWWCTVLPSGVLGEVFRTPREPGDPIWRVQSAHLPSLTEDHLKGQHRGKRTLFAQLVAFIENVWVKPYARCGALGRKKKKTQTLVPREYKCGMWDAHRHRQRESNTNSYVIKRSGMMDYRFCLPHTFQGSCLSPTPSLARCQSWQSMFLAHHVVMWSLPGQSCTLFFWPQWLTWDGTWSKPGQSESFPRLVGRCSHSHGAITLGWWEPAAARDRVLFLPPLHGGTPSVIGKSEGRKP